jgi:hypothetical protein
MVQNTDMGSGLWRQAEILCAGLMMAALVLSACAQKKKYTWRDRMPTVDCEPRTAKAREELGGCPKLADYQHPTLEEQREFVSYMNKKNAIEGTLMFGDYYPPGCLKWSADPTSDVPKSTPIKKPGCEQDLEKKLRNFSVP